MWKVWHAHLPVTWKKRYGGFLLEAPLVLALLVCAYLITYRSGARGFFAFDQSIVFDGSYRVLSGQIPYRDFVIPFGPVVFWLQGAIFRLVGVSYASYIFGAALGNVLATGGSFTVLRLLLPESKWAAYLGGALTAVWFYAPFATPWPEQTAFLLGLGALILILTGRLRPQLSTPWRLSGYAAAGGLAFAAFMSKQNAGALFIPVGALLLWVANGVDVRRSLRATLAFTGGWLLGTAAFGLWLLTQSDPGLFYQHFFAIPALEGGGRLPTEPGTWVSALLIGPRPKTVLRFTILFPFSTLVYLGARRAFSRRPQRDQREQLGVTLVLALCGYQNLFLVTSNNQLENSIPFTGIIAALSLGLLWPGVKKFSRKIWAPMPLARAIISLGLGALTAWMFRYGVEVAYSRQVHSIFEAATFPNHLAVGKLSAIQWGVLPHTGPQITAEEVNQLVDYLEAQDEHFFVFPDFTILYGVMGVPSPQPLLWFHEGLTYPRPNDPILDAWVVASLTEHQVNIIVIETESWFGTDERLADFPQLEDYLQINFTVTERIGEFLIYARRE